MKKKTETILKDKVFSLENLGGFQIEVLEAMEEYAAQEARDMFLNMQYYMEYCQSNDYVTPMDWITNHKHF